MPRSVGWHGYLGALEESVGLVDVGRTLVKHHMEQLVPRVQRLFIGERDGNADFLASNTRPESIVSRSPKRKATAATSPLRRGGRHDSELERDESRVFRRRARHAAETQRHCKRRDPPVLNEPAHARACVRSVRHATEAAPLAMQPLRTDARKQLP